MKTLGSWFVVTVCGGVALVGFTAAGGTNAAEEGLLSVRRGGIWFS